MKSTGNDIVALNAIDIQRTTSPAFYSKFITVQEQALYRQSQFGTVPFQNFIWLLWSVKESAYKYLKRSQPDLIFPPAKIIIQNITVPNAHPAPVSASAVWESNGTNEGFYTGEVIYGTHRLYFRSKITAEFIASVVNDAAGFENVYWGVSSIEQPGHKDQSREARGFILKKLMAVLKSNNLHIGKSPTGYPIIIQHAKQLDIPVSLAHHDHFVAYSFLVSLTN